MGTAAEKLAYLQGTKEAIKQAINAKKVSVPDNATFREYADKIFEIGGGFDGYIRTGTSGTVPTDGEVAILHDTDQQGLDDKFAVAVLTVNDYGSHFIPMVLVHPYGQYVTSSGTITPAAFDSLVRGGQPGNPYVFQSWYWSFDPYGTLSGKPYTMDVYVYVSHG